MGKDSKSTSGRHFSPTLMANSRLFKRIHSTFKYLRRFVRTLPLILEPAEQSQTGLELYLALCS
jgi:hypothetical protein